MIKVTVYSHVIMTEEEQNKFDSSIKLVAREATGVERVLIVHHEGRWSMGECMVCLHVELGDRDTNRETGKLQAALLIYLQESVITKLLLHDVETW